MQHRLKRGRGFIIRNANREAAALRVPPVFEGAAHINDDAALAARLHWCRRRTGDARRPHLSQQLAPATRHRRTGDARRPRLSRPYAGRAAHIPHLPVPPHSRRPP